MSFSGGSITVRSIETISLQIRMLINIYTTNSSSGGGFAAVAASDKFQSHGIMPVHVLAGAAPLMSRSWTPLGFIRSLDMGILGPFDALNVALVGLATSNTRSGVLNYNTTQSFLKVERVAKLLEMFTDLDAPAAFPDKGAAYFGEFVDKYPENFEPDNQYVSNTMFSFFETALDDGDEDPCMNDALDLESLNMDLLCEELKEADLRSVAIEADYPIDLCHSRADALVAFENVPDASLLKYELEDATHGASFTICQAKLFEGKELKKATLRNTKPTKAPKAPKAPKVPEVPKA